MKCRLILILMLLAAVASATPLVDPAPLFKDWPWTAYTNTPWETVDTNHHVIKQLQLSLEDRANAVGVYNMPAYQKEFRIAGYVYTNFSYTNWAYWTPTTNIFANTNQVMTNYNPHMALYYFTNLWNAREPWTNVFPKDVDVDGSGLSNSIYYIYISLQMLQSWRDAIDKVMPSYMPQGVGNVTNLQTNAWAIETEMPGYTWGQLLKDADVCTVSNELTDGYGYITNAQWVWSNAPPTFPLTSTTVQDSAIITLAGLSDLAACIAQLNKVKLNGVPCSPAVISDYDQFGWDNNGGYPQGVVEYTDVGTFRFGNVFPFAWAASSTDSVWYSTFVVSNAWGDLLNPYQEFVGWTATNHNDWTVNGWRASLSFDVDVLGTRDTNIGPPTNWAIVAFGAHNQSEETGASMSFNGPGTFDMKITPVDGYYVGVEPIDTTWSTGAYWRLLPSGTYDDPTHSNQTINLSTTTTIDDSVSKIEKETIPTSNTDFIVYGDYVRRNVNPDGSVDTNTTVTKVWTNNQSLPAHDAIVSNDYFNSYTLVDSWSVTNKTTNFNSSVYIPTNFWKWEIKDIDTSYQQAEGTLSIGTVSATERVMWKKNLCSIRTEIGQVFSNFVNKAVLYVRGGDVGGNTAHRPAGGGSDWSSFTYSFSNAPQTDLMSGLLTNRIERNKFVKVKEYSMPGDLVSDPYLPLSMLIFTSLYDADGGTGNYEPYHSEVLTRKGWAINKAVFVLQYAFTNRW